MSETDSCVEGNDLTQIELDNRIVVLARIIEAQTPEIESSLKEGAANFSSMGENCLGSAVYLSVVRVFRREIERFRNGGSGSVSVSV